ncbi:MAG: VOC family protein [Candidatus Eisenbacteria bacterium]|nr:VOC family protein [Candidatus Eisenbacteria bacterium]MCC7144463.1 VOC family protein [Candidatus Eisenbacteria bacterium]
MTNHIAHFAIHADDCARAKQFYETAFGWTFTPWGPPDFWLIRTGQSGIQGALQKRREAVQGRGMIGFECTIAVANIQGTAAAVSNAGGKITCPPFTIEKVGTMIQFEDPEGNVVCAMQYEPGAGAGA